MKKIITSSIFALTALTASAQLPVSTVAGKKKVLLEEYTGIACGYCPDGHRISDELAAANPGKFVAINIHTGGYAKPQSGDWNVDYRTADGDSIAKIVKPNSFPTGSVNRRGFTNTSGATVYVSGRNNWTMMSNTILGMNSYVNIAGEATLNPNTRLLTVNIEAYYTASAGVSSNKLTVALLQNNILGPQAGASTLYPAMMVGTKYKHNHMLKDVLTNNPWGDNMGATTAGTKYTRTITYTVPTNYKNINVVLADLDVVAFVAETEKEIMTSAKIPVTITTTTGIEDKEASATNFTVYPNPLSNNATVKFEMATANNVSIAVVNALGQTVAKENLGTLNAGSQVYELDATDLTKGLYFLNITIGENTITKKVSVIK